MRSLNTHGDVSKQVPNSSILGNNYKLDSLVVNKGRIHEELRYFQDIPSNLIKSDKELR